jgi:hypothetical protein
VSYVTSVVVASPYGYPKELVREMGERMYAAHMKCRGREVGTAEDGGAQYYAPVDHDHSDGGKYPSGSLWWLGLNMVRMDEFVRALDDPRFAGTTVWHWAENDDNPTVVTIGPPVEGRWGGR